MHLGVFPARRASGDTGSPPPVEAIVPGGGGPRESGRAVVTNGHEPLDSGVAAPLKLAQQPFPGPVTRPTPLPVIDRLPRPIP